MEKKEVSKNNYNKFDEFIIKEFNVDLDEVALYEATKTQIEVVYYDEEKNDFNKLNIKEFFILYSKHNKEFQDILKGYTEEKMSDKIKSFILDFKVIKGVNKFIKYSLDLTADKPYIKTKDNTIILTYNSLSMPQNLKELQEELNIINVNNIDVKEYKHYISPFIREYFEELNDLLQFITIFLFYTDKKSSFLNLISPSNFGKTDFLIRLLTKRLNIAVETEHKILEYTPSPLSYNDFLRKGTFLIDEFKVFRHEFKIMTDQFKLNPKGEKQVEVELFSKLFFSKEKSKSFKGVIDTQIINRVFIIDKTKTNRTIPKFLEKHPEIDAEKLKDYLTIYYWRYFNKYINYYRRLDFEARQKILKNKLDVLKEKYKIRGGKTTEEYIKEVFYTYLLNVIEKMKEFQTNEINLDILSNNHKFKLVSDDVIYISKFETFLKNILRTENEDYYNNVKHTVGNDGIIDILEYKTARIQSESVKIAVVKFDVNKLKEIASENGEEFIDTKEQKIIELQTLLKQKDDKIAKLEEQLERLSIQLENYENENESEEKENESFESYQNNDKNANEEVSKEVDEYFGNIDDIPFK